MSNIQRSNERPLKYEAEGNTPKFASINLKSAIFILGTNEEEIYMHGHRLIIWIKSQPLTAQLHWFYNEIIRFLKEARKVDLSIE